MTVKTTKTKPKAGSRLFRKAEVARFLGVSAPTLMRWTTDPKTEFHRQLAAARLPRANNNELVLFRAADIRALLKMEETHA